MKSLALFFLTLFPKSEVPSLKPSNSDHYYIAFNPTKDRIEMAVNCGREWNMVYVDVEAQDSREFRISTYNNSIPTCFMDSYKAIK